MAEVAEVGLVELKASCNFAHTWHWWHRFCSLPDSTLSTLLRKISDYVLVRALFLTADGTVALDGTLSSCWKLGAPFYSWVLCTKTNSPPQTKKVPLPFPALWLSSALQLLLLPVCLHPFSGCPIPLCPDAPHVAHQEVQWRHPAAALAPASHWGSLSWWRPLWTT